MPPERSFQHNEAWLASLTETIIGMAIRVHRHLGRGLLETVYTHCLCWELQQGGLRLEREAPIAVAYGDVRLPCGYRADVIVEEQVILEIKSVERLVPLHEAQLLTYLRLSGCRLGLLMNFNGLTLKDGLRRFIR